MSEESCKSLHRIGGYLTAGRGLIDVKVNNQENLIVWNLNYIRKETSMTMNFHNYRPTNCI